MDEWGVRIRGILDEWFAVTVVVLLVVAGAGAYLTYGAYAAPGTHTEERTVGSWESTGSFDHSATVVNGTEVFAEGETVSNRSVYFRQVMPILDGSFTYGYQATGDGVLETTVETRLVIRSVSDERGSDEESATEYWRVTDELGDQQARLAPSESVSVEFSQNVTALAERIDRIREDLGSSPGTVESVVVARVQTEGQVNGEQVSGTKTYRLPITVSGDTYRVDDPGAVTGGDSQTESVTVPNTPGPLSRFGGPLLLALGALGLVGLIGARTTDSLAIAPGEREWLAYRDERREFDDWVTEARLPDEALDGPRVEVASLQGLVDLAIDTDRRVVEDRTRGGYYVPDDRFVYVYVPPTQPKATGDASPSGGAVAGADESSPDEGGTVQNGSSESEEMDQRH